MMVVGMACCNGLGGGGGGVEVVMVVHEILAHGKTEEVVVEV